jgi:hypothetical protein
MTEIDILQPNPFAKPIFAEKGNKTAREIYTAVGFALDRWEHCDVSFAVVYSALVKPRGGNHTLMRAFGTIAAPKTKKEMTWEACDAYFASMANDGLRARTRKLLNLYSDASARRNEIAHACVMAEAKFHLVNNAAVPLPNEWFLVPPLFASRKNEMFAQGPKYRYSTVEIAHFTKCFEELHARASKLSQDIRAFFDQSPHQRD